MIDFDMDLDTLVTELKQAEKLLGDKIFTLQCAANALQKARRVAVDILKEIDDDKKAGYNVYDPSDPVIVQAKTIISAVHS